jgi:hypothetical protein
MECPSCGSANQDGKQFCGDCGSPLPQCCRACGSENMKNILVINDEAHHCYREKPKDADDEELKGDDRKEAEKITKRPGFGFRA